MGCAACRRAPPQGLKILYVSYCYNLPGTDARTHGRTRARAREHARSHSHTQTNKHDLLDYHRGQNRPPLRRRRPGPAAAEPRRSRPGPGPLRRVRLGPAGAGPAPRGPGLCRPRRGDPLAGSRAAPSLRSGQACGCMVLVEAVRQITMTIFCIPYKTRITTAVFFKPRYYSHSCSEKDYNNTHPRCWGSFYSPSLCLYKQIYCSVLVLMNQD